MAAWRSWDEEDETVAGEIARVEASRARLIAAKDANPHLDHWKHPWQLGILDRQLAELRGTVA